MAQKWRTASIDDKNASSAPAHTPEHDGDGQASRPSRQASRADRRKAPAGLTPASLEQLAITYVARYATSSGKLGAYLNRKIGDALRAGAITPEAAQALHDHRDDVTARLVERGYVDDRSWAGAQIRDLIRRGYGAARIREKLYHAAIAPDLINQILEDENQQADPEKIAMRFAEKHKLGPFGAGFATPRDFQRAMAKMLRAGHPYDIANKIVRLRPADINVSSNSMK